MCPARDERVPAHTNVAAVPARRGMPSPARASLGLRPTTENGAESRADVPGLSDCTWYGGDETRSGTEDRSSMTWLQRGVVHRRFVPGPQNVCSGTPAQGRRDDHDG